MRQLPGPLLSARLRVICAALFALGIALVDLSAVWAQGPAPLPAPIESPGYLPGALGCASPLGTAASVSLSGEAGCSSIRPALSHCFTSDCRDGASLMATSRPHSALSRSSASIDTDASPPGALHLHRITPMTLLPAPTPSKHATPFVAAFLKPARKAGADHSIPRPPPN